MTDLKKRLFAGLLALVLLCAPLSGCAAREAERMESRQKAEGWLDPALKARISCHEVKWTAGGDFQYIQAGGDLYFHRVPQTGTMLHSHDFAEILLVTGGCLTHQVNGDRQRLEPGSLCFLRPDDLHGFAPDALNFQSLSRFYCLFRRQYGVSPGAYRRLHAGEKRL